MDRPNGPLRPSTLFPILLAFLLAFPFSLASEECASASTAGRIGKPDFSFKVYSAAQGVDTPTNYEYGTIQVSLSDEEPIEGVTVIINATVFNTGTTEGTVDVSFYDGHPANKDLIGMDTLTIKALRYDTAMSLWNTTNEVESHTIWVVIDLNNTVDEENKDNNNATKDVVIDIIPMVSLKLVTPGPGPFQEDEPLELEATVSDTVSDIDMGFQYNWSFDDPFGNQTNPEELTGWNISSASHSFSKEGTYNISLLVTDDGGAWAWTNTTVSIINVVPVADFTYSRADEYEDTAIIFDGLASRDTATDKSLLRYKWDLGNGLVTGFEDTPTVTNRYDRPGTYTVKLTVRDDSGSEDQKVRDIDVRNMVPTVDAGADREVSEDEVFTLKALANDTLNDLGGLIYQWTISGVLAGNERNSTVSQPKAGVYEYVVTVLDNDMATGSDKVRITVRNIAPTAQAKAEIRNKGTEVMFKALAEDTPSDLPNLTYAWEFGDGSSGKGKEVTHDFGTVGTFTAAVTVTDDDGASAKATVTVKIENLQPIVSMNGPSLLNEDEEGTFVATASDKDGSITETRWDLGDGTTENGLVALHTYTEPGTYTVRFTARDDWDGVTSKTMLVLVSNVAPTPQANWSRVGFIDEPVSFDGSRSLDSASDMDSLEFSWSFGDGAQGEGKHVTHRYSKMGDYEVMLNVTDAHRTSAVLKLLVTIIERVGNVIEGYLALDLTVAPSRVGPASVVTIKGQVSLDLPGGIGEVLNARKVEVTITCENARWALLEVLEVDRDGDFEILVTAPKAAGKYPIKAQVSISDLSAQSTAQLEVRSKPQAAFSEQTGTLAVAAATIGLVGAGAAVAGTDIGRWKFFALLIPLYTRLRSDSVLDHFERGRIFEYIGKNPGAHYSEIKFNLDLNNGVLAYHLNVLERERYIKSRSLGLYKRFYPFSFRVETERFVPIQDLIVGIVRKRPGISQIEMAKTLGVPRSTVNYQCNMLVRSGEIRSEKLGRKKMYWPQEET